MQLPRMTTRRWMVAVALVALALASGIGWHRLLRLRRLYRSRAELYAHGEQGARSMLVLYERAREGPAGHRSLGASAAPDGDAPGRLRYTPEAVPYQRKLLGRFAELREKHERAAANPWLPVDRDPPWPNWISSSASHEPSLARTLGREKMPRAGTADQAFRHGLVGHLPSRMRERSGPGRA